MDKRKFYITTPIYYVNDKPHVGSAYTTIAADALARAHRLRQIPTYFLTGTDENSQKNLEAAAKAGVDDLQAYLDSMAEVWKRTWRELGISFDDFIRTTEERHHRGVERFWRAVEKSGDINKATYEREYCVGCEEFKTPTDLLDGKCPLHPNRPLEKVSEENYFFRASNYKQQLLDLYRDKPEFVQPQSRQNEIRSYVESAFDDLSISRESKKLSCGIPVPGDDSQRIYVWFDALINYMTAVGYGTDDEMFRKWWPASLHLVGKDIIKFHCALWPAMIMSAAKSDGLLQAEDGSALLPERVYAHGFFTIDGQKISKSLGNAVDPLDLAKKYPFDAVRYFLLREIPFGEDGDFSTKRLEERYASDLGNRLGNLVNRVIAMSAKYFDGKVPQTDVEAAGEGMDDTVWDGAEGLAGLWSEAEKHIEAARLDLLLDQVWNSDGASLTAANKLVEQTQPFKLFKEDPEKTAIVLYALLEACRQYAWMVEPIMPNVANGIIRQLGQDPDVEKAKGIEELKKWGGLVPGTELHPGEVLFPRLIS
ncbi:methionine--tRNA ligase [Candidatus Uhrbacteria bacterium]|nr:methionine--tRNA ligase [Candidatus Uhrbacteria bacterium]